MEMDALVQMGIKRACVTWYDNAVRLGKRVLALGYCEHGKGVAFISVYYPDKPITEEWLKLLVIRDVLFDDKGCNDAKWCFNLKCPLNRAELKHFRKYGFSSLEQLKSFHETLEDAAKKLKLEPRGSTVQVFKHAPLRLKRIRRKAKSESERRG